MIRIRAFEKKDLEEIRQINFLLGLSLEWNGAYHAEDAFVAVDEGERVVGAAALFWDGTWYYLDKAEANLPSYRMQMEIAIAEECTGKKEVKQRLIAMEKEHFAEYKKKYPDKELCLRCWCEDTAREEMQELLESGFTAYGITMVLGYDLTGEIPAERMLPEVTIGLHNCDAEGIRAYLTANEAGYDGVQDSADEFCFRLQGEGTAVLSAVDAGGKVVSSCTVWTIGEGRYATENVFTIPEYRRRGIGSETLYAALRYLKEKGGKQATLTVVGKNRRAIAMYLKMGYRLVYNMYEMHYQA